MRKYILTLSLLMSLSFAMAQSITLRFTAEDQYGNPHEFSTVKIENLTRNWQHYLTYPDTELVLQVTDGIDELDEIGDGLSLAGPNPFKGTTQAELQLSKSGNVEVKVLQIDGKLVARYEGNLPRGTHRITFNAAAPQMYLLVATTSHGYYATKLMNIGYGSRNGLEVDMVSETTEKHFTKSRDVGYFLLGDQMRYTAFGTTTVSNAITQQQYGSEDITLQFIVTPPVELPQVVTNNVTNIGTTSATGNGEVISDGGATVTERGVCWSTAQNPTVGGNHVANGYGLGSFSVNMPNLLPNTTYYVCAYATNSAGTAYGEQKTFTTSAETTFPIVVTNNVTNIVSTSAMANGEVVSDGGATVTERGICWSTAQSPTISGAHVSSGAGLGSFSVTMPDLSPNTSYYVRAYAINSIGTSYGEQKTFTTSASMPQVITNNVTNIGSTSATGNGEVVSDGGATVTERGVCWSTEQDPTISGTHAANGMGVGSFSINMTDILPNTTYYVRAYAINSMGTAYGEHKTFTTSASKPVVVTNDVTNIGSTYAMCNGEVVSDGGASVIERGICLSTMHDPDIYNSHANSDTGVGSFSVSMTVLLPDTTYYVRAYATNSKGTSYGEQKTFKTKKPAPTGGLPALYSVSETKKVYFSQGNLLYQADIDTWSFGSQFTYFGSSNANISTSYSGWIDLFGWGTGNNPTNASKDNSNYRNFIDWGSKPISNGGNQANLWRTLTIDEWKYLLFSRTTSSNIRYAKASIDGIGGVIILPDDWNSSYYTLNSINTSTGAFTANTITLEDWVYCFQTHGAVFLPAAGKREGTDVNNVGTYGYYWSSTPESNLSYDNACMLRFRSQINYGFITTDIADRYRGYSVRLVADE